MISSKSAQLDFPLFAWLQGILRFLFFYHQSQTFRRMRLSLICLDEEKSLILLLHPNPLQVSEKKVIYVLGEVERLFCTPKALAAFLHKILFRLLSNVNEGISATVYTILRVL